MRALSRFIPSIHWIATYKPGDLRGDAAAGLTTAIMLIPQAMAYAMLAGLPPIIGLYASIVPLVVYALLGTSRHTAMGPVATVSLLVASGVGALAQGGTERYLQLAISLALLVGVVQLAMGVLRLGYITNFLSQPVLSGFNSATALIIGFSQVKHLMGIKLESSHAVHDVVIEASQRLGEVHWTTLAIGVSSIAALMALKKWKPMFPGALTVVVLSTLAVWGFGLDAMGVQIVGDVPAGLPSPSIPMLDPGVMGDLLPTALTIALVGFVQSISVAKAFARQDKVEVDADQELIAMGAANLVGSFFRIFPVTGGFGRTAVNAQAGARTPLAGLLTAVVVALGLLFFTPLFHFLPQAVLAAIIMTAVFGLIDVQQVAHLWRVKRSDLALLVLTFAATLSLGIEPGLAVGVGASLLWFVIRSTRPHFAVLGRVPGTQAFRNLKHFPEARTWRGVLIVRMDAQFYFGNVSFLKERLQTLVAEAAEPVCTIIVDAGSINQLDASADAALHELLTDFEARKIRLLFAGVKGPVREVMKRSGLYGRIGANHFFFEIQDAVDCAVGVQGAGCSEADYGRGDDAHDHAAAA